MRAAVARGELSRNGLPAGMSDSVPYVIDVIAGTTPAPDLVFLSILRPYDPGTDSVLELKVSNTSGPSNDPVPAGHEGRLVNPFEYQARLSDVTAPGALISPAFGSAFFRTSGPAPGVGRDIDAWADYDWTARPYEAYVGIDPAEWPDGFAQIFRGSTEHIELSRDELYVHFRDLRGLLEVDMQTNLYAGTGGLEGDDTIKDTPKPLKFGPFNQEEAVLVDPANLIYQFHDGSAQSLTSVQDDGGELDLHQSVIDIAAAATPPAGKYTVSLPEGMFRLGDSPGGKVLCSGEGDNSGPLGYVSTVASIIRKVVGDRTTLTDPDDLELGSFIQLDAEVPYEVGTPANPETMKVDEFVEAMLSGANCYGVFTVLGRLKVGRRADPATQVSARSLDASEGVSKQGGDGGFGRTQSTAPHYRIRFPYKRYGATINPSNADAGLTDAVVQDYSKRWRWVTGEDATLLTPIPAAKSKDWKDSVFVQQTEAQTEADRLQVLFESERSFWSIELDNLRAWQMFSFEIGSTITYTDNVYGLGSSKKLTVVGLAMSPRDRKCTLTLWG